MSMSSLTLESLPTPLLVVVYRSLTSLGVVENNHRQPYLLEFIDGDHVHRLVQFYVVELQSCVHPCHSKAELQLEDLLDFLDFLDHQNLQTDLIKRQINAN